MKTILRIGIIVLVMLTISAGYWFIVNQSGLITENEMPTMMDGQQPERPDMDTADFSANTTQAFPERDSHHEGASSRGISQILAVLLKIVVIAAAIILLQKFSVLLFHRKKLNQIREQV